MVGGGLEKKCLLWRCRCSTWEVPGVGGGIAVGHGACLNIGYGGFVGV